MGSINETPFGHIIHARNVNGALISGLQLMRDCGVPASSRGISTLRVPGPVLTIYKKPCERVLFNERRDANPFFHLMESLWILSGSNRVELPSLFLKRIKDYSDDGKTFHGAYGHRLRSAQGIYDQLKMTVGMLQSKPDSRQVVLSIWDPILDLGIATKDMPCNDMVMLDIVDDKLNMTVCNRSNDMIWGAYGANVVQFSMIQEWIASAVGVGVGYYVQQSNNYHVYTDNQFWQWVTQSKLNPFTYDLYVDEDVRSSKLAESQQDAMLLLNDCYILSTEAERQTIQLSKVSFGSRFFNHTVKPALTAHEFYRQKDYTAAIIACSSVFAEDWRIAMTRWLQRRKRNAGDAAKEEECHL